MAKGHMSGVSTHPMSNIEECYDKVLAQSKSITELTQKGANTPMTIHVGTTISRVSV